MRREGHVRAVPERCILRLRVRSSVAGLVAVALAMCGCKTQPGPRIDRILASADGLVVSNSPMYVDRPLPRRDERGRLGVTYSFLVENRTSDRYAVGLGAARFGMKGRSERATCSVSDVSFAVLRVFPGERYRIDCRLELVGGLVDVLSRGDADGTLAVPLVGTHYRGFVRLEYRFRVEDLT